MARYRKIDKAAARQLYNNGGAVFLCPSKIRPDNPYGMISCAAKENCDNAEFEAVLSNFSYYNCNKETGMQVSYYVPD